MRYQDIDINDLPSEWPENTPVALQLCWQKFVRQLCNDWLKHGIGGYTDRQLVEELRRRGYAVTDQHEPGHVQPSG